MAAEKKRAGAASARVAANVRRLRNARGLSTYELSRQLKKLGWQISATSITRIEQNERRVDADDLMALSILLGTTPNGLLLPNDLPSRGNHGHRVEIVTGVTVADPAEVWAWADGDRPLVLLGPNGKASGPAPSGSISAAFAFEAAPHRVIAALVPGDANGAG